MDPSEDEGFQSASNLTPDSQSEPGTTPEIDLWDAALTYEPSKQRCWEQVGWCVSSAIGGAWAALPRQPRRPWQKLLGRAGVRACVCPGSWGPWCWRAALRGRGACTAGPAELTGRPAAGEGRALRGPPPLVRAAEVPAACLHSPPGRREEPYLTEAGRDAFDRLCRLCRGELQVLGAGLPAAAQPVLAKECELVKDALNVLIGVASATFPRCQVGAPAPRGHRDTPRFSPKSHSFAGVRSHTEQESGVGRCW